MTDARLASELRALQDRIEIQDVICAVTLHSDLDEPERALAQYVPGAQIDYSQTFGPDSANVPVEKHRANLQAFLPGFDKRQHQVTNFQILVDGDDAIARSQCCAVHTLGQEVWTARGTYHHRLKRTAEGWRINYQRVDMVCQDGEHLVPIARQRVTDRQSTAVSR
ncbi:hypothetical protein BH10PSE3_BH10PSE3_01610 [soil metagenome]